MHEAVAAAEASYFDAVASGDEAGAEHVVDALIERGVPIPTILDGFLQTLKISHGFVPRRMDRHGASNGRSGRSVP